MVGICIAARPLSDGGTQSGGSAGGSSAGGVAGGGVSGGTSAGGSAAGGASAGGAAGGASAGGSSAGGSAGGTAGGLGGGATGEQSDGGPSLWDGGAVLDGGSIDATFNRLGARYGGQHGVRVAYLCAPDLPGAPSGTTIYGTFLYTDDSSVCRAAIHAGAIAPDGGWATIEVRPGASSYQGSTRNGLTSLNYGSWSGSFFVVP